MRRCGTTRAPPQRCRDLLKAEPRRDVPRQHPHRDPALRCRPRPCALQGPVRPGRGPDPRQAPADRAVGPADPAAVPGAGDDRRRRSAADHRATAMAGAQSTPSPCCRPSPPSRPCAASPRPAPPPSRCSASATRCSTATRPRGRGRPSGPSSRRDKQACPQTLWQRVAGLVEKRRSVRRSPPAAAVPISIICARSRPCTTPPTSCARWPRTCRLSPRRHPARRQGHRDGHQEAERPWQARPVPRAALRHPRHHRRRDRGHQRAGPDPDATEGADRARRRLPVGLRSRRPQARRRLGDPVGLQHRRRRRPRRRGPVRPGSRLHLRRRPGAAGVALGGRIRRPP